MFDEIIENLKKSLSPDDFKMITSKKKHLGIFTEPYLSYMLNGQKTIESRISKNKIAPYNKISKDDVVIIKKSGGDCLGYFTIKDVMFFDLRRVPLEEIKNKYAKQLCVGESFWLQKKDSNYATLLFIDELVKVKPFHIDKNGMQTWISF